MKALIIEDEPRARSHMTQLLDKHFPDIEVVGATGSVKESLAWLESHPTPDVIFMDVELADGSSFQIFTSRDISCPVIMTTAYDQYAIQAFEVHALDYLLKPVNLEDLRRAISRIPVHRDKFLVRLNGRIVLVRSDDIACFYSEDKNTYIVTNGGPSYIFDLSLDALSESLDPGAFFRISRSCIVSEGLVASVDRIGGGRLRVVPKAGRATGVDLTVSRARTDDFVNWLRQ